MTTNSSNPTTLNLKLFYKELGQLLYAVAYADGKIRKQEVEALREFVVKELLPSEYSIDSSGMNQVFYTQFEFDEFAKNAVPTQAVFANYITYLKENAIHLTEKHKTSILHAVEKVAGAYKHTNKKEEELIIALKTEINHL